MTTPTQGEHAQTEAMYAAAMEYAAEKASISYVQRKCRCSYNDAERMLERMVDEGIIETYGGRKTVATTHAQPAAPQGVAYAELPEPDSYLFQHDETGLTQFVDAQQVEWGFQQNNPRLRRIGGAYTADKMRDFADRTHALRASNGKAPAGAKSARHYGPLRDADAEYGKPLSVYATTAQAAPAAGAVAGPGEVAALRMKAVQACATANGRDWEFMYSGHQDDQVDAWLDGYSAGQAAAPTPAAQADSQPAMDRDSIREIFMTHGFTVKEGQTDLKQYVYDAADALLRAARAPADSVLEDAARWFSERDNVLHSFWVLLGEAETQADNDNNPLLKHQVEGFYRQWNALNGSALETRWVTRAARKQGGV